MNEHTTWLDLLPGYHNLEEFFRSYLGRTWHNSAFPPQEHFTMTHVFLALFAGILLLLLAWRYRRWARTEAAVIPPDEMHLPGFLHVILETLYKYLSDVVGDERQTRRYFPLGAGIFLYIFLSNLLGLVPGIEPPTAHLQMNLAIAITVFLATHYFGIREKGWGYIRHFTGDVWYLVPLMLPLELISHLVRPLSLTVRLLGNMFADHKVIAIFTLLFPLILPLPFFFLGFLVTLIQALVFMTLSVIYFSLATSHEH